MGLNAKEQAVMDRFDAGVPKARVIRELGISQSYYEITVSRYSVSLAADRQRENAIAEGSRRLAHAVNGAGGHR